MKALTVEEYAWLSKPTSQPDAVYADADEREMFRRCRDAGLVEAFYVPTRGVGARNTPHGDRAVRVHRAWLQSMGAKA